MLQDHKLSQVSSPCRRHRWAFTCWLRDRVTGEGTGTDIRHGVDRCRGCGMARITAWRNGVKSVRPAYAESLNEAILGAKLSEFEGELIQARVGAN